MHCVVYFVGVDVGVLVAEAVAELLELYEFVGLLSGEGAVGS